MEFSEEILNKIPVEMHSDEHFRPLLETVNLHQIKNKEQLTAFLDAHISQIGDWLKSNNMTGVAVLKQMTLNVARLERYKLWKEWCGFL
ncbi:hypothetical protein J4207_01040 [Candidatus Woesearchaeota archaeon]|nr:hypothetical protein [Candidatus Woesearchaeota archaeon]